MERKKIDVNRITLVWILTGLLFLCFTGDDDSFKKILSEKLEMYKKNYPMDIVYIHTDKDVYSPGDELLYKVYVKDFYSSGTESTSGTITVIFNDPEGSSVMVKTLDLQDGRASGNFELNRSLAEGTYKLIGYTDLMQTGKPENVFYKELAVHKIYFPNTIIHLSTPDTIYKSKEEAEINVRLLSHDGKPYKRKFVYNICLNGTLMNSGEGKTDKAGKGVIRTGLPDLKNHSIVSAEISVSRAGVTDKNHIILPVSSLPYSVDFYPESGQLVHGIESRVGFVAKDYFGEPIEIEGQLVGQNNNVISNFKSTFKGLGYFTFVPDNSRPAVVRIIKPSGIAGHFQLPEIVPSGTVLTFDGRTNDLLKFRINGNLEVPDGKYHIAAEQDGRIVWYETHPMIDLVSFDIPVRDLQRGIIRVILFDTSGNYLAQRSVYLYKRSLAVRIKTDRNEYIPNEQILLDIDVLSSEGYSEFAELSVSVTDANLNPDWNSNPDFLSCFTLGPAVAFSPFPAGYFNNPSEEMIQNIDCLMMALMDNKYKWKNILTTGEHEPRRTADINFTERVLAYHRPDPLTRIYEEIEKDRFFNKYILKYNLVFPEYYLVNRRYFVKQTATESQSDRTNWIQKELASGTPLLDVIRRIRNFQLLDNKMIFYGPNSILNQEGALFVLNGIKIGTDIRVLNDINPFDVETIRVITDPTEVLMYTGFNPIGIVEITTKGEMLPRDEPTSESEEYNPTLYWNPFVFNLKDTKETISIESTEIKSSYNIVVQGVDDRGNPVYEIKNFSVF